MSLKGEFYIDKLTHSIEEVATGTNFETNVIPVDVGEIRDFLKKNGWFFNWKTEFKIPRREIYKLVAVGIKMTQGLISLEIVTDQKYVELHLIENAPHNFGENKLFSGVAGNLVAYACRRSFELGFSGLVAFTAKSQLVDHYVDTLGAQLLYGSQRMVIPTSSAINLVSSYYPFYFHAQQ